MRVLHLNDFFSPRGGVEVYLSTLVDQLTERNHEVAVAYGGGEGTGKVRQFCVPSISSVAWGSRGKGYAEVRRILEAFRPDVCHVHSVFNPGAIRACLDYGRTILHLHDYRYCCPSSGLYFRRHGQICERRCSLACFPIGVLKGCQTPRFPAGWSFYRRVRTVQREQHRFAAILANSRYVAERFRRNTESDLRLEVLPYFCPVAPLVEPAKEVESSKVLFLGRVRESKGILPFVRVVSELPADVVGVIAGDADVELKAAIEREATRCGCRDRIQFTGWVSREEIAALLRQAAVVLFPSLWAEPFGIVGLEAMARGVPVVAFDVGGVRDWLVEGSTGYLVESGDVAGMARRAGEILADPSLRLRLGAQAIQRVKSSFALETHMRSLLEIYESGVPCQ